jgi:hypothetical protein
MVGSVSKTITSELAETHTLTVKQHCCFSVQSTAAEKLVGQEVWSCGHHRRAAKHPRYPKLCAYPKYGEFTLTTPTPRINPDSLIVQPVA